MSHLLEVKNLQTHFQTRAGLVRAVDGVIFFMLICRNESPPFVQLNEEHFSLCHFAEEVYTDSCRERGKRGQQKATTQQQ